MSPPPLHCCLTQGQASRELWGHKNAILKAGQVILGADAGGNVPCVICLCLWSAGLSSSDPVCCLCDEQQSHCMVTESWFLEPSHDRMAQNPALPPLLWHPVSWVSPKKLLENRTTQNVTFLTQAMLLPFHISESKNLGNHFKLSLFSLQVTARRAVPALLKRRAKDFPCLSVS